MNTETNVVKFPFAVSRRAPARKKRWSKNGTPEERAADLAQQIETLPAEDKATVTAAIDGLLQEQSSRLPGLRIVGGIDTGPTPIENEDDEDEEISVTCKNGRLRKRRRAAWRAANAAREYWRARWKLESAIAIAQSNGIAEGNNHPIRNCSSPERGETLGNYRAAIGKQLLTPASDARDIAWKKAVLKANDHAYTDVTTERAERAIAEDAAWLDAHPTRRTRKAG